MKKINFQALAMMLLALLFSNVVPAAEKIDSKKRERLWCLFVCDDGHTVPTPDSTKPKPASKTKTEKR